MEKRVGVIAIIVTDKSTVTKLNTILSEFSDIILGRMGLPIHDRQLSLISLIIEGTTDRIGALTGKIGRLGGVEVKSTLAKYRGELNDNRT